MDVEVLDLGLVFQLQVNRASLIHISSFFLKKEFEVHRENFKISCEVSINTISRKIILG